MERRLNNYTAFYAMLLTALFEDPSNIDDQLVARVMPHIGVALKWALRQARPVMESAAGPTSRRSSAPA